MPPRFKQDPTKQKCNLCEMIWGNARSTDTLWLRSIRGKDYLVCAGHLGRKHVLHGR